MNSKPRLKLVALNEMIQKDLDIEEVFQQRNMVSVKYDTLHPKSAGYPKVNDGESSLKWTVLKVDRPKQDGQMYQSRRSFQLDGHVSWAKVDSPLSFIRTAQFLGPSTSGLNPRWWPEMTVNHQLFYSDNINLTGYFV